MNRWWKAGRNATLLAMAVAAGACAPGGDAGGTGAAEADAASPADRDVRVLFGRLIDGTGSAAVEDGVVVVTGTRITCSGPRPSCRVPEGAREIPVEGGTILPGLIDLHVHARPHYLGSFLMAGVTTVRDANNSLDMVDMLLAHDGPRPRIVWSGPMLDGERSVMAGMVEEARGPRDGEMGDLFFVKVGTPAEARAAVDTLAARGAGVVKLYEQLDPEVFEAAVGRAGELGLRTMTDLGMPGTRGLSGAEVDAMQAVSAGVTSIEHAGGYALAYQRLGGDPTRMPFDPGLIDTMARATVEAGVAVVPTLSVFFAYSDSVLQVEGLPAAENIGPLLEFLQQGAERRTAASRESSLQAFTMAAAVARRVRELGGLVGAGSDTPAGVFNIPGGSLHRELELLVREGATPVQALHSATGGAAAILGRDDVGLLRAGFQADILIVDGRPDEDILATRRITTVIQGGEPVSLEALRVDPDGAP